MVGKNQLQITGTQLAAGLATSDYLGDGGMGTNSQNINPLINPGVVYATSPASNTGLGATLIASCEDFENPSQTNRFIADSNAHFFYVDNGGIPNAASSGSTGYSLGITDMVPFINPATGLGAGFISFNTGVGMMTGTVGAFSYTDAWWTSTKSKTALNNGSPHPMLVYQNQVWIGNGNHLANFDSAGTANDDASWVLDKNEQIFALGIDPVTGLMMVSARSVLAASSGATPARNYIYLYDGYSAKPRRKIPVQGTVFSFTPVGGQIFVGIDNSIGIWNGNGVSFLRRLSSITSIPYKHLCAAINNYFFVADGTQILAYGDIINGKKAWFPIYKNIANSNSINVVFQNAIGTLATSYDSSALKTFNLFSSLGSPGTAILYTNYIDFQRPVNINRIRVVTTGITTTAGLGGVSFINENNQTISPTINTFVVASGTKYVFDFDFGGTKTQTFQPKVTIDTQQFGVAKIIVYYTVAE